jgi:Aldehyde:ferredoxin oxidoreductase
MSHESDTLPRRFFDEPIENEGFIISREEFETLKKDYYRIRGWDEKGKPANPLPFLDI